MTVRDLVVEQFHKQDIGIKFKELSEGESQKYEDIANKRYHEYWDARDNESFHLFERLGHSSYYDPRVWLIDFLAGRENIIAITRKRDGSEVPSYWFATGEDAYRGMGHVGLMNYWLLDSKNSFFIVYDYRENGLYLMGEELVQWAKTMKDQFYTMVGLSPDNYDYHLLDARVENWGRRVILDCIYKPKNYSIDRSQHMTIFFSGCNKITFEYMSHRAVQKRIHPKLWMWMGYRPAGAEEMSVPANLSNISVDIKFTYESITVIKDRSHWPPEDNEDEE